MNKLILLSLTVSAIFLSPQQSFAETNIKKNIQKVEAQIIELQVTDKGYEPASIDVKSDRPIVLKITRKTDETCATNIKIPSKNIKKDLPLNQTVTLDLGVLPKGETNYSCSMNMIKGVLNVK